MCIGQKRPHPDSGAGIDSVCDMQTCVVIMLCNCLLTFRVQVKILLPARLSNSSAGYSICRNVETECGNGMWSQFLRRKSNQ